MIHWLMIFGGAFEIENGVWYGDFNKVVDDPFFGDVIDYVMLIFHPHVDLTHLLKHATQSLSCSYIFMWRYARQRGSRNWLVDFQFWEEFGSIEFMPVSAKVSSLLFCVETKLAWITQVISLFTIFCILLLLPLNVDFVTTHWGQCDLSLGVVGDSHIVMLFSC